MKTLRKSSSDDFWTFLLCVLATVSFGTQGGLIVGITTSFLCALRSCILAKRSQREVSPLPKADRVIECASYLYFLNRHTFSHQIDKLMEVELDRGIH